MDFFKTIGNALTSGVSSMLTGGLSSIVPFATGLFGKKIEQKQDVKAQKDLMSYQNNLNNSTWHEQFNAQNERQNELFQIQPSLQRAGMENAGFSPASLAGGFSNVGAVSNPSANSTSQASVTPDSISNLMGVFNQAKMTQSQIDVNKANVRNIDADTELKNSQRDLNLQSHDFNPKLWDSSLRLNESQIAKAISDSKHTDADTLLLFQRLTTEWEQNLRENALVHEQIEKLQADTRFVDTQELWYVPLLQSQINLNVANGILSRAEAHRAQATAMNLEYDFKYLKPEERSQALSISKRLFNEAKQSDYELSSSQSQAAIDKYEAETRSKVSPVVRSYVGLAGELIGVALNGTKVGANIRRMRSGK